MGSSGASQGAVVHARTTTGSVAGAGTAAVTVTWPTAFSDTNYTAVADVVETTAAGTATLRVDRITAKTTTGITVRVVNSDAVTARTGTVQATAAHD